MRNMNLLKTAAHSFLKKLHKGKKKRHQPIFLFATDGTKKVPEGTLWLKRNQCHRSLLPKQLFQCVGSIIYVFMLKCASIKLCEAILFVSQKMYCTQKNLHSAKNLQE